MSNGWIAVDLDGTLAHYDKWVAWNTIGAPIAPMVDRVKRWLEEGRDVRIMTARANIGPEGFMCRITGRHVSQADMVEAIQLWCQWHLGASLPVTFSKDFNMIEQWDDRAVQVEPNTGRRMDGLDG